MPAPHTPHVEAAIRAHQRHAAERAADDPTKLAKARRAVTAAVARERLSIEDHIAAVVAAAPPLTADQRARLAALLAPATVDGEAGS